MPYFKRCETIWAKVAAQFLSGVYLRVELSPIDTLIHNRNFSFQPTMLP